jgi:hypothetical protein
MGLDAVREWVKKGIAPAAVLSLLVAQGAQQDRTSAAEARCKLVGVVTMLAAALCRRGLSPGVCYELRPDSLSSE